MSKILITGGAGFVGSNLARKLLKNKSQIILTDNLSRKGSKINFEILKETSSKIKLFRISINRVHDIIVKEKPDLIYHFAAQVAVTNSVIDPYNDFKINAEGTFNVAKTAYENNIPFIYTSTNKVFGDNVNKIPIKELKTRYDFSGELAGKGISEDFPIDAKHHTPYGCSKLTGDVYTREFGGIVNRCSCMYGENQFGIVDQGWVSYFVQQKLLGKELTIFGNGKQVRDLLYIDDVIALLELEGQRLLEKDETLKGEVFNIGGGFQKTISLLELCEKLAISPKFGEWRPSDQKVFYCNVSKAKKILNWEPKVSVEEGIERIVNWSKQNIHYLT